MTSSEPTKLADIHKNIDRGTHLPSGYDLANVNFNTISFAEATELKDSISKELFRLGKMLEEQGVDMHTSLLSDDKYPRQDLDIVTIRLLRNKIIALRNDFDTLMGKMDQVVAAEFERRASADADTDAIMEDVVTFETDSATESASKSPFLLVQDVLQQSPGFAAGLQVGDKIVAFDTLSHENTQHLTDKNAKVVEVGKVLQKKKNQEVKVEVLKKGSETVTTLKLIPNSDWSGFGLLGCKLVQL